MRRFSSSAGASASAATSSNIELALAVVGLSVTFVQGLALFFRIAAPPAAPSKPSTAVLSWQTLREAGLVDWRPRRRWYWRRRPWCCVGVSNTPPSLLRLPRGGSVFHKPVPAVPLWLSRNPDTRAEIRFNAESPGFAPSARDGEGHCAVPHERVGREVKPG